MPDLEYAVTLLFCLLLMSVGYGIIRFVFGWRQVRFFLYFPAGLAASGVITTTLWLAGFSFFSVGVVLQAFGWTLLPLLVSDIWLRTRKKWQKYGSDFSAHLETLQNTLLSFWQVPWIFLAAFTFFSLLIYTLWSWSVLPIHWDNLTLYNYRAEQMVSGWHIEEFQIETQRSDFLQVYDWSHPFFASSVLGLSKIFGVENPSFIPWALMISVLAHAAVTWQSWRSRILFASILFLIPTSLSNFIEGYAVIYAVGFWLHFFLYTLRKPNLSWSGSAFLALLASAAIQSRSAEPYWILIFSWLFWHYRAQWKRLLPFLVGVIAIHAYWMRLAYVSKVQVLLLAEKADPVARVYVQGWQTWPWEVIPGTLLSFILSPSIVVSLVACLLVAGLWLRKKRLSDWLFSVTILLFFALIMLLAGMIVFALGNPVAWQDIRLALPRSSLFLLSLTAIILAEMIAKKD